MTLTAVTTLENKFDKYMAEHRERESLLAKLSACATPENLAEWELQRQTLENDRIADPKIADKYLSQSLTQSMLSTVFIGVSGLNGSQFLHTRTSNSSCSRKRRNHPRAGI